MCPIAIGWFIRPSISCGRDGCLSSKHSEPRCRLYAYDGTVCVKPVLPSPHTLSFDREALANVPVVSTRVTEALAAFSQGPKMRTRSLSSVVLLLVKASASMNVSAAPTQKMSSVGHRSELTSDAPSGNATVTSVIQSIGICTNARPFSRTMLKTMQM